MTETARRYTREYSNTELIFGNLAIILWIGLGALSCAIFYPLTAFLFFGVAAFLVFYELGKHGCVTCYYCKTCTVGMGKLPDLFFKKDGTANVNRKALRLFPFVYVLLSLVPIGLVVLSIIQEMTLYNTVLLATLLLFSLISGTARSKTLLKVFR